MELLDLPVEIIMDIFDNGDDPSFRERDNTCWWMLNYNETHKMFKYYKTLHSLSRTCHLLRDIATQRVKELESDIIQMFYMDADCGTDEVFNSFMEEASYFGDLEFLKFLVSRVDKSWITHTTMELAVDFGETECLRVLINNSDISVICDQSSVTRAAEEGYLGCLILINESGRRSDTLFASWCPLRCALIRGNLKCAHYLNTKTKGSWVSPNLPKTLAERGLTESLIYMHRHVRYAIFSVHTLNAARSNNHSLCVRYMRNYVFTDSKYLSSYLSRGRTLPKKRVRKPRSFYQ